MSHESIDMPNDFGTHQRLNNSGLLHASKTMCAGALNVRVTTSSRSASRSTPVRFMAAGLPSFPSGICLLLAFQVLDNLVQRVEACAPELAVPLDPGGLFFQRARAKPAGSDAPGLSVVTSAARSNTPTCFFMPVRVIWNFPARSVIEASARLSCSSTPRRVASDSAANEASRRVSLY